MQTWWCAAALLVLVPAIAAAQPAALTWNTNQNRVSADIKSLQLPALLEQVANATGWQVFLEPGTKHQSSVKFKDLPPGDALKLLLGNLNFVLVPQTNAASRLYVFHTSQARATRRIAATRTSASAASPKAVGRELTVRLKPGARIEDIARLFGARVVGRIDSLNLYRLEFDSEDAARAARRGLLENPDVAGVESNFVFDYPNPVDVVPAGSAMDFNLKPRTNSGDCQVVIGLPDSAVHQLGNGLDVFVLPSLSVAGESSQTTELSHGTAMAETILRSVQAATKGSSSVKILPVDIYGKNPTTTTFDVMLGILQAVNGGANVINLSLGSEGDSQFLHDLIQKASQQGVVFFGAAGNQPTTAPTYPAAYPEVMAVTAGAHGQIDSYANRGSFVDIIAPGTSVVPYQGQSYVVTGTSAATAYATGLAAGLADAGRVCPDQILAALRSRMGGKTPSSP